jgi:RNA polymerase sigma factor (TIGR02999 family)
LVISQQRLALSGFSRAEAVATPARDPRTLQATRLLEAAAAGEPRAAEELLPLVYEELHELARSHMAREPAGHTLQATALVHEAYLRLLGPGNREPARWSGRGHFFAAAARAMRRSLVERARRLRRIRHGGELGRVELTESVGLGDEERLDLLALDGALARLEALDARRTQVLMLRYFAGLSVEEAAAALDVSPATVKADWSFAGCTGSSPVSDSELGRAARLFEAALAEAPERRSAFVRAACTGDQELAREVESLLAHHERATSFLAGPAVPFAPGDPAGEFVLARTFGRYRLLERLGAGGTGVVYLAEQEQLRRRVALKVLRAGLATQEVLARFRHEAELLARLHHPGITQVYEAAEVETSAGPQPYVAMEHVQGMALDEYARARSRRRSRRAWAPCGASCAGTSRPSWPRRSRRSASGATPRPPSWPRISSATSPTSPSPRARRARSTSSRSSRAATRPS